MEKIIYNVASFQREDTLLKTIDSIYDFATVINISLNSYEKIPFGLYDDKINILITDNSKGDAFKFHALEYSDGYFFTIDDDLIYRKDYTNYMIDYVEKFKRKTVISLHGRNFKNFPILSYYKSASERFRCLDTQLEDSKVQFGGTGVMCFHTDLMKFSMNYFQTSNMADIWVGKYCFENNIDIICAKHQSGLITQQRTQNSIFDTEVKNDLIQTKIVNETFQPKELSIIIPTYNQPKFLLECLDSIMKSIKNMNCEILVGIDDCKKTIEFLKNKKFDKRIRFFNFKKNQGPYVIKNSLSKISKSDYILFFDSDDLMMENMVQKLFSSNNHNTIVKPMYEEFLDGDKINWNIGSSGKFGEGVFMIKKDLFNKMNGFEGWRCAADSDFMNRIYKSNFSVSTTHSPVFMRRLHNESLTQHPNTNYASDVRANYYKLSKKRDSFGALLEMKVEPFLELEVKNVETEILQELEKKVIQNSKILFDVLNKHKPISNVDYQKINERLQKQNVYDVKSSQKPIRENKPKNRQELVEIKKNSNASQVRIMNPGKPNRRNSLPNIFKK